MLASITISMQTQAAAIRVSTDMAQPAKAMDLFTALAHPLWRRILRAMMNDQEHAVANPRKLSISFDEEINHVSDHVRMLRDCSALKLVKIASVRGATQHFYRCSLDVGWARMALESTKD